jgi:hypothetical protein
MVRIIRKLFTARHYSHESRIINSVGLIGKLRRRKFKTSSADYRRHLEANASNASLATADADVNVATTSDHQLDSRLSEKLESMKTDSNFLRMLNFRKKLPAFKLKNDLVTTLKSLGVECQTKLIPLKLIL